LSIASISRTALSGISSFSLQVKPVYLTGLDPLNGKPTVHVTRKDQIASNNGKNYSYIRHNRAQKANSIKCTTSFPVKLSEKAINRKNNGLFSSYGSGNGSNEPDHGLEQFMHVRKGTPYALVL
jgi:hypothetical protein